MLAIFPGGLGSSVITISASESPPGPCVLPSSDTSIREPLASEFVKQNSAEKSNLPAAFLAVAMRDIPSLNNLPVSAGALGTPKPSVSRGPMIQEIH